MIDYRLPDPNNRRKYFLLYYYYSMHTYDCDPAMYMMDYVCNRLELNIEQRYWFSWLYGHTYNVASAYALWNEFPDFERIELSRITKWYNEHVSDVSYQSDLKWNRGCLPEMVDSYVSVIRSQSNSQYEFFNKFLDVEESKRFDNIYYFIIDNFYKFGRYSTWFYLQTLKEICGLNIIPNDLRLWDSSAHTQRAALSFILADDEKANDKKHKYSESEINNLQSVADSILNEIKDIDSDYKDIYDFYNMETVLCAFKKTFRIRNGRYIGYYHDRVAEDIYKMSSKDYWKGIDWDLLWDARAEMIPASLNRDGVSKALMSQFINTGVVPVIQDIEKYY